MSALRKFGAAGLMLLVSLAALDAYLASLIFSPVPGGIEYFLDVGAGESELIEFAGGVKVLIDSGPPGDPALKALAAIFAHGEKRIDIVIISLPSPDRYGGLSDIIDAYDIGVVLWSGREPPAAQASEWAALTDKLEKKNIPILAAGEGDGIKVGDERLDIISPDAAFVRSPTPAESSIVARVTMGGHGSRLATLFMGGGDFGVEEYLTTKASVGSDVLKVGGHGGRNTSGAAFLKAVHPFVAVIEAGGKVAAGLPSKYAVARIVSSTDAMIMRTDMDGTIKIWPNTDGSISVTASK